MTAGALGAKLRAAGLTPRALAAWLGTDRLAAVPDRLDATPPSPARAAAILELFVRGATVPAERVALPIDELVAAGLVEATADGLRARVAVLPLGRSLVVCDRGDAPIELELVCWPDDSSHHLAAALPAGRRARWLDLGCGSAFAPLARPELAARITGVDRNPRAVHHARLGAALSGVAHLEIAEADLGDAGEPAELVTCNAPIPEPAAGPGRRPAHRPTPATDALERAMWRTTDRALFARLFRALPERLSPDAASLAVVHAARDAIPDELPGERVIVTYTPPGTRAFAVLWWRPHAPARQVTAHRGLSIERPHLDAADRDDALAAAP